MHLLILLLLIDIVLLLITIIIACLDRFSQKCKMSNCFVPVKPDLIITASETLDIISSCIKSFSSSYIDKIIVALDHPSDSLIRDLFVQFGNRVSLVINYEKKGKIPTQIAGINFSKNDYLLLVDADIKLLGDIKAMCQFMHTKALDFVCPYSVGEKQGFWPNISDVDRMFRQRIIRAARNFAGLSNLTGYFLLCKKTSYLRVISPNYIQDDVVSTLRLQNQRLNVGTYEKVMCSEIERPNFAGILFQRIRWTAGNLSLLPGYRKLLNSGFLKAAFFFCTFLLWYYVYYIDCAVIIFSIINQCRQLIYLLLIEYFLRGVAIKAFAPSTSMFYICMYQLLWPFLNTLALILVPIYKTFKLERLSRRKMDE